MAKVLFLASKKKSFGAVKTTPWAKVFAIKADDLGLIPGTQVAEREQTPISCPLASTCTLRYECPCVHVKINKKT